MTDIDRLRRAADKLEGSTGERWGGRCNRETAALLRAMADAVWFTASASSSGSTPPEFGWGEGVVHDAAQALANAILGSRDVDRPRTHYVGDSCPGGHRIAPFDSGRMRKAADELIEWAVSEDDWDSPRSTSMHWHREASLLKSVATAHDEGHCRCGQPVICEDPRCQDADDLALQVLEGE